MLSARMKPFKWALPLLVATCASVPAHTAECRQTTYGQCFQAHARYNIYADGDGLWIVGTKHRLVAVDDKLDAMLEKAGWQDHSLFGDFVVCPQSAPIKGHAQNACIQSYTHLRLADWH